MKRPLLLLCALFLFVRCGDGEEGAADLATPKPDLRAVRCDLSCPVGETCWNGACTCDTPTVRCGNTCIDLAIDNQNCGACGKACADNELCANSQCALSCPLGQTGCNGKCSDLMTDNQNCGACNKACPMGQTCTKGNCL